MRRARPSSSGSTTSRFFAGDAGTSRGASSLRARDHLLQTPERLLQGLLRRSEREAHVGAEAGGPGAAALAGIDVEEDPRHRDDLALERGTEERLRVAQRLRQPAQVAPAVKGPFGLEVELDAEALEPLEHEAALGGEGLADGVRLLSRLRLVQEIDRGALHRAGGASVEERAGAAERGDDLLGADGPAHAPAGVAPVLR